MSSRIATIFAASIVAMLVAQIVPAAADPPDWAPARGWRAKHHEHEVHERVIVTQPRYIAVPAQGQASCNRELLGTVFGGGVGAAAGSQIGKGNGKIVAVIAGTVVGGLVGGSIGRSMDQLDVQCLGQTLEHARIGQPVVWQNPDESADYRVTPTRTYQTANGQYCREYTAVTGIAGREQQVYGTACRQADGSWQIRN